MKTGVLDRKILTELIKVANEVCTGMKIKDGLYTAWDLANRKDCKGNPSYWNLVDSYGKEYKITVGTFTCTFESQRVFQLICEFERICGVKKEARVKFRFGNPNEEPITGDAMFLFKSGKVVTRKIDLVKYSDRIAVSAKKGVGCYFHSRGIWYLVMDSGIYSRELLLNNFTIEKVRSQLDALDFNSDSKYNPIYRSLKNSIQQENV